MWMILNRRQPVRDHAISNFSIFYLFLARHLSLDENGNYEKTKFFFNFPFHESEKMFRLRTVAASYGQSKINQE